MIGSAMGCIDFLNKKEIPRKAPLLLEVLSQASYIESLISLVLDHRFHTALRQRAGDILTLGKTNETVVNLSRDSKVSPTSDNKTLKSLLTMTINPRQMLQSVKRLASSALTVADYPLSEQVVYFLHILYKRLNSKRYPSAAAQILKTFEGTSLALYESFPLLSNPQYPFYDKLREAFYEDQVSQRAETASALNSS